MKVVLATCLASLATAKLDFGLNKLNLDNEAELFGAGAGDRILEAVLDEDWVNTDSRRFLLATAGSAWVDPGEEDKSFTPEEPVPISVPNPADDCLTAAGYSWCDITKKCQTEPCIKRVGGAKDEGGCFTGAGYKWCSLKGRCLRPWEEECETPTVPPTNEPVEKLGASCSTWAPYYCNGKMKFFEEPHCKMDCPEPAVEPTKEPAVEPIKEPAVEPIVGVSCSTWGPYDCNGEMKFYEEPHCKMDCPEPVPAFDPEDVPKYEPFFGDGSGASDGATVPAGESASFGGLGSGAWSGAGAGGEPSYFGGGSGY